MPYYDYKCRDCAHTTTVQYISHKDAFPTIQCAWCAGQMDKQAAAPNFVVGGYNAKNSYGVK